VWANKAECTTVVGLGTKQLAKLWRKQQEIVIAGGVTWLPMALVNYLRFSVDRGCHLGVPLDRQQSLGGHNYEVRINQMNIRTGAT
jgi:hypothetical protein